MNQTSLSGGGVSGDSSKPNPESGEATSSYSRDLCATLKGLDLIFIDRRLTRNLRSRMQAEMTITQTGVSSAEDSMETSTFEEKMVTDAIEAEQSTTPVVKTRPQVKSFEYKIPRRKSVKVFSERKLRNLLMPVLNVLMRHEHSPPFLQPVDAEALGLVNYNEIVKHPMDLSTIRNKLESGTYDEPWQFIHDVWLMLDNALRFNRKGSNVYRGAESLGKIFEETVDVVMQSIGYCCGKRLFYTPPTLFCIGKRVCIIPRDTTYYSYAEEYIYCKKCFSGIAGDQVPLHDERHQVKGHVSKDQFVLMRNDHLEPEPFVPCKTCGRIVHQICVMYLDDLWPDGFQCEHCRGSPSAGQLPVKLSAESLPMTFLSNYLENRVNNFLTRSGAVDVKITIRVVSIRDRLAELKPQMKARHPDRNGFPYRAKAVFAFLQLDGHEVAFFGMHVQEYGSDCPPPNHRRVYIGYLDSVQYFRPRELRTSVYREILLGYLCYVKERGFLTVHIWACPPGNDDDYIFHCHPPEQKIPQPGRLQDWYKTILRKGQEEGVVLEYKNLFKYVNDENLNPVDDLPYFEGDFWPMILDDSLKDIDKEEEKKKEKEANSSSSFNQSGTDSRTKKKPKKTFNKGLGHHQAKDLPTKMMNVIKRHQDSFLVVILNNQESILTLNMKETEDADFLIYSDLMDGRDGLLSVAMERHYEFSSYRRAMFSTMLVLFELSHRDDQNVFMCSSCNLHFTKGFRCKECGSLDMCATCQDLDHHIHEMTPIETKKTLLPRLSFLQYMSVLVDGLIHAVKCLDSTCKYGPCVQFKELKSHAKTCSREVGEKCEKCRPLAELLKAHAKYCTKVNCPVLHCPKFKMEFRKERVKQKFQHNRCLQRRMRMMLQQMSEVELETTDPNNGTDHDNQMEVDA